MEGDVEGEHDAAEGHVVRVFFDPEEEREVGGTNQGARRPEPGDFDTVDWGAKRLVVTLDDPNRAVPEDQFSFISVDLSTGKETHRILRMRNISALGSLSVSVKNSFNLAFIFTLLSYSVSCSISLTSFWNLSRLRLETCIFMSVALAKRSGRPMPQALVVSFMTGKSPVRRAFQNVDHCLRKGAWV